MQEDLTGMPCDASAGCGATSKWSIATAALETFLPTAETKVNWGLKLFASGSNSSCSVSTTAEVAPAPSNAAAISTVLDATVASSSTPTTLALTNAAAYLKSFTDPNPKFILLVTDGSPTCGASLCPAGTTATTPQCDDENAIAKVHAIYDGMGIPVFVLGIGTSMSPGSETLSRMAMAGGYPRAASPAYYPIESGDDLSRAFGTVSGLVASCYLIVTPAPKSASEIIDVKGDGTVLPADPANGWTFATAANSAGIRLNGKACEDYKSGAIKSVAVDLDLVCAAP